MHDQLFKVILTEEEKKEFIEELRLKLEEKEDLFEKELRDQILSQEYLNRSYNI